MRFARNGYGLQLPLSETDEMEWADLVYWRDRQSAEFLTIKEHLDRMGKGEE